MPRTLYLSASSVQADVGHLCQPQLVAFTSDRLCAHDQMVDMEATNAELEDNNTRLEAAAMQAAEHAAELASLRTALKAREQQHLALKVRTCPMD